MNRLAELAKDLPLYALVVSGRERKNLMTIVGDREDEIPFFYLQLYYAKTSTLKINPYEIGALLAMVYFDRFAVLNVFKQLLRLQVRLEKHDGVIKTRDEKGAMIWEFPNGAKIKTSFPWDA